jgi:hypothetical protein
VSIDICAARAQIARRGKGNAEKIPKGKGEIAAAERQTAFVARRGADRSAASEKDLAREKT